MSNKKSFQVQLPNGKSDTRHSTHNYKFAVVVREQEIGKEWGEWGAWRYSEKIESAKAYAKYLQNCPSAKLGTKFETQITPVNQL